LGSWISPCYGPFSVGAFFETYELLISLVFKFFRAAISRGSWKRTGAPAFVLLVVLLWVVTASGTKHLFTMNAALSNKLVCKYTHEHIRQARSQNFDFPLSAQKKKLIAYRILGHAVVQLVDELCYKPILF
jgi:hypothetical protein